MREDRAEALHDHLTERFGDDLRSVVAYDREGYEVVYLRPDVHEQYDGEDIDAAMETARMDAFSESFVTDLLSGDHGEQRCLVRCYEEVVELNFVLSREDGVAVGVAGDAFVAQQTLLGELREVAAGRDPD